MPLAPGPHASCTWPTCLLHLAHMPLAPGPYASCTWPTCLLHLAHMSLAPGPHASCTWPTCLLHLAHRPPAPGPHASGTWPTCLLHLARMPLAPGPHASCIGAAPQHDCLATANQSCRCRGRKVWWCHSRHLDCWVAAAAQTLLWQHFLIILLLIQTCQPYGG
jgi:hypothetical protein